MGKADRVTGTRRSGKSLSKPATPNEQHSAIRRVIVAIPQGYVTTYGEVAMRAGLPRRARLVGTVLRQAAESLRLPWHRVVRANGRIAFYPGSVEFRKQCRRLRAEGVEVNIDKRSGRVDLDRFGWQRDLDAEIWSPFPDHFIF